MKQINITDAEENFYKLIKQLESKQEDEIIITKDGKAVASLKPVKSNRKNLFGCAKGILNNSIVLDEFNSLNQEITNNFFTK